MGRFNITEHTFHFLHMRNQHFNGNEIEFRMLMDEVMTYDINGVVAEVVRGMLGQISHALNESRQSDGLFGNAAIQFVMGITFAARGGLDADTAHDVPIYTTYVNTRFHSLDLVVDFVNSQTNELIQRDIDDYAEFIMALLLSNALVAAQTQAESNMFFWKIASIDARWIVGDNLPVGNSLALQPKDIEKHLHADLREEVNTRFWHLPFPDDVLQAYPKACFFVGVACEIARHCNPDLNTTRLDFRNKAMEIFYMFKPLLIKYKDGVSIGQVEKVTADLEELTGLNIIIFAYSQTYLGNRGGGKNKVYMRHRAPRPGAAHKQAKLMEKYSSCATVIVHSMLMTFYSNPNNVVDDGVEGEDLVTETESEDTDMENESQSRNKTKWTRKILMETDNYKHGHWVSGKRLFYMTHKTRNMGGKKTCPLCLYSQKEDRFWKHHFNSCFSLESSVAMRVPQKKEAHLDWPSSTFKHPRMIPNPMTIYYDFESILANETVLRDGTHSILGGNVFQVHKPSAFALALVLTSPGDEHYLLEYDTQQKKTIELQQFRVENKSFYMFYFVSEHATDPEEDTLQALIQLITTLNMSIIPELWIFAISVKPYHEVQTAPSTYHDKCCVCNESLSGHDFVTFAKEPVYIYDDQNIDAKYSPGWYNLGIIPPAERQYNAAVRARKQNPELYVNEPPLKKPKNYFMTYLYVPWLGKILGVCHFDCQRRVLEPIPLATADKEKMKEACTEECTFRPVRRFVPAFAHNADSYDSRFLIRAMAYSENTVTGMMCQNKSKFRRIEWGDIQFLDSFQFLPEPLAVVVKSLKDDQKRFMHGFAEEVGYDKTYFSQKGYFPYSYYSSTEVLKATELPPIEQWYDPLSDTHADPEHVSYANEVYNNSNCRNFLDYLKMYLFADVCGLADVMETYREVMFDNFKLDITYYMGTPGFTLDACILHTKVKLDLLDDLDMYTMFERGIRGGVSQAVQHYAKAEPGKSEIFGIDANSLYPCAMKFPMPISDFEWLEIDNNIEELLHNIRLWDEDSVWGFTVECDLECPEEVMRKTMQFPLAPHTITIDEENFTYTDRMRETKPPTTVRQKKLCTTFLPKTNYVVHVSALKFYVEMGLIVTKVHKVIRYKQSRWMGGYIDHLAKLRADAEAEGNMMMSKCFKQSMNSLFGKTCENVRKHSTWEPVTNNKEANKLINGKKEIRGFEIIHENLVLCDLIPLWKKFCKPVFLGQTILDVSKFVMYRAFYKDIIPRWPTAKLLGMDTDSFYLLLEGTKAENIAHFKQLHDAGFMDTANYPKDHVLYSPRLRKVPGCFSNDYAGDEISEVVFLRAKCYALKFEDDSTKFRLKGVPRRVVLRDIMFRGYLDQLKRQSKPVVCTYNKIQAHAGQYMATVKITKKAISAFDDKFICLNDCIHTLPHGITDGLAEEMKQKYATEIINIP